MEIPEDRKVCISSALWSEPEPAPAALPHCLEHILHTVSAVLAVRSACDFLARLAGGILHTAELYMHEVGNRFCRFGRGQTSCLFNQSYFRAQRSFIFTCLLQQLPVTLSCSGGGKRSCYQSLKEHLPTFLRCNGGFLSNEASFSLPGLLEKVASEHSLFTGSVKMLLLFRNAESLKRRKTNTEQHCWGQSQGTERGPRGFMSCDDSSASEHLY